MPSRSPSRSRQSPHRYGQETFVGSRDSPEEKEARDRVLIAQGKKRSRHNRNSSRERTRSDERSHAVLSFKNRGRNVPKSPSAPRSDAGADDADPPNNDDNRPVRSASAALDDALGLAPMEQGDPIGEMGDANPDFAELMQRTETTPAQQAEMDAAARQEDAEREAALQDSIAELRAKCTRGGQVRRCSHMDTARVSESLQMSPNGPGSFQMKTEF